MCIVDVKRRIIVRFLFQCNPFRRIDFSREKRASLEKLKNGLNEGFYSVNHDVSVLMKHKPASSDRDPYCFRRTSHRFSTVPRQVGWHSPQRKS